MTTNDMDSGSHAGKPVVFENHGRAETNSQNVAVCFEKRHADVIRSVRTILKTEPSLSQRSFALAEYADGQGKVRPTYNMDRDGFTLVAMGFTGSKALKFKVCYIAEFNRMEDQLRAAAFSPEHRDFPDWPLDEMRTKRGTADLYRMVFGPLAAQWIMPQLGFPEPPRDLIESTSQMGLGLEGLPPHPASADRKAA